MRGSSKAVLFLAAALLLLPPLAYAQGTLTGTVRGTWLRGAPIDLSAAPRGRLLRRAET